LYGQRTEIGSLLAVPLRFRGRVLGVLAASRKETRAFHDQDEATLNVVAASIAQDFEQARMLREATTDPLTGLMSRLALLSTLPREVETARRYQTGLSLVLVDIDGLRTVNEAKGRAAGDLALVDIGQRLAQAVRSADLAVRFGGDEFALLLPMTEANDARAVAKRLQKVLLPVVRGLEDLTITASFGVATLAVSDEDALGLLWRADKALQLAKSEGGNCIAAAHPEKKGGG
jgi:diguanylate cyclase (GGDEF)-like protein